MDGENDIPLFKPSSDVLRRARRAHESGRLALASFIGGALAGFCATIIALVFLVGLEGLFTCVQTMVLGALVGAGIGIGGIIRMSSTLDLFSQDKSFDVNVKECGAIIAGCAGFGSLISLAFNSHIFQSVPIPYALAAIVGIMTISLAGAAFAYVSQTRRPSKPPAARETGNPYQPPLS